MPLEKCGHVPVTHELAPSRLIGPLPDCLTGPIIYSYPLALLRNDRDENSSGLSCRFRQFAHPPAQIPEQLRRESHYISRPFERVLNSGPSGLGRSPRFLQHCAICRRSPSTLPVGGGNHAFAQMICTQSDSGTVL
jgi:hypothetical protein